MDDTLDKVTLPSGAIVGLLVPTKLKAKHQNTVMKAVSKADQRFGAVAVDLATGVVAMLVQEWTVPGDDGEILPIPSVDYDSLGELDLEDYEFLLNLPQVKNTAALIGRVRGERVTPDDYADERSPTVPSGAAKPRLRGATSRGRTTTRGGKSTSTRGGQTVSDGLPT